MSRLRSIAAGLLNVVRLRTRWHYAALAGAGAAILSDLIGTNNLAKVGIGLAVTITIREFDERAGREKRRECGRRMAQAARGILDARLQLTRIDQMILGRWLTLRRIAELAREGQIHDVVAFGGPAKGLAAALWTLSASFETEIGRCHARLRSSGQDGVDTFVQAMKAAAAAADAMMNVPPYDPATAEDAHRRLFETLTAAVAVVERSGDAVDQTLDPVGARTAAEERREVIRAQAGREGAALGVLIDNGRAMVAAADAVDLASLARQDDVYQAVSKIRELGLHVDSRAFYDATDAARKAHRAMTYGTLAEAQVASADRTELRRLLEKLLAQLTDLEAVGAK